MSLNTWILGFVILFSAAQMVDLTPPSQEGAWLGVSHQVGKLMSHWVLPQSGVPILATAVQRVTNLEKQTDEMKKRMDNFQLSTQCRWDARTSTIESPPTDQSNIPSLETKDEEFAEEFNG